MKTVHVPIGQASVWMLVSWMMICVAVLAACAEGERPDITTIPQPTPSSEPATATNSPIHAQSSATASAPKRGTAVASSKLSSTAIPIPTPASARTPTPTAVGEVMSTPKEPAKPTATAVPESNSTNTSTPTSPLTIGLSVTPVIPKSNIAVEEVPTPEVAWTPVPSPLLSINLGADPMELLFLGADTVARVKLIEVEGHIFITDKPENSHVYFRPEIRYEFEVLEYLKGIGSDTIWTIVYIPFGSSYERGFPSEESEGKSRAALAYYLSIRENLWDESEAIVFLKDSHGELESTYPEDHYYIGDFFDDIELYSTSAHRKWLPLASLGNTPGAAAERTFLLEHPNGHVLGERGYPKSYTAMEGSGAVKAVDTRTVELSELRTMAAMSEEELSFLWGLSAGYAAIPELTASSTHDSVTLNWELNAPVKDLPDFVPPTETGYSILRNSLDHEDFTEIASLSADVLSYADTDIAPSTEYTYILRMFTIHDHSVDVQVKVTTTASPTPEPVPSEAPCPPQLLYRQRIPPPPCQHRLRPRLRTSRLS